MKKILIVGNIWGNGGIQTHLNWLIKALQEEQVKIFVISLSPFEEKFNQNLNIDFFYFENSDENQGKSAFKKIQKIKILIEDFAPDVYMVVGTSFYSVIPICIAKHKSRKIFHEVMSGFASGWKDPRWIVRWCFDEVVAQTATVAKNFSETYGWKKEIPALAAMPIPLEKTASLPNPVHKTVPLGQAKVALFSRLVPWKKAFWLVQQWELLKDVISELHIHGTGPEESLIREYIESQEISDRVKCFGRYPEGQGYVDLLSSYDLTLLPTVGAEGAPLVLLESMACGVPFVAYGVGGIVDYGVNNPNVIIVPPEHWLTDQAREYSTTTSVADNAFISGVKKMLYKLSQGEIDQIELQNYYLHNYSYSILKQAWLSYLCG